MTLERYLWFLVGDEDAIRSLAAQPSSLWIGLILVASAAVSRNHARRDLVREWAFLLVPFAASLLAAGGLFGLIQCLAGAAENPLPWSGFRPFLALFWLSAPLAWLYALPVERYTKTHAQAVAWRMKLLGVVALWRVLLTVRILSLFLGDSYGHLLAPVLLFGDGVMLLSLHLVAPRRRRENVPRGTPEIMRLMGGVLTPRSREQDKTSSDLGCILTAIGLLAFPLLVYLVWQLRSPQEWSAFPRVDPAAEGDLTLWLLAGASLAAWCALLPGAQAKWARARAIEASIAEGDLQAAAEALDATPPDRLPHDWEPLFVRDLCRSGLGPLLDAVEQTADLPPLSSLRRTVMEQLGEVLREPIYYYFDDALLTRLAALIPSLPQSEELAKTVCRAVRGFRTLDPARRRARYERSRQQLPQPARAAEPRPIPEKRVWPEESAAHHTALEALRAHCAWDPDPLDDSAEDFELH